tara:strand:+ start:657 stop:1142 length:486 start_codon:yes stop_codon:yes gene_type:complete
MNNPDDEKTLRNLGVICALTQNDKINTQDDNFVIYVPTALRGLTRKLWYRESREHNINRLKLTIRDAKNYIINSLNELNEKEDSEQNTILKKIHTSTKLQSCNRMTKALTLSQEGLRSLKITYKDDATCITEIDICLNEIQDFIETTNYLMKSSPTPERFN